MFTNTLLHESARVYINTQISDKKLDLEDIQPAGMRVWFVK